MALPLSDDGEHVNMILCGYTIYEAVVGDTLEMTDLEKSES